MSPRRPRPDRARPAAGAARSAGPARPARTSTAPVPLERGRSYGVLAGLFGFAVGFAVAAVEYLVVGHIGPVWWTGITVGLFGIGATGFFLGRGTVPRPEAALWKPEGLTPWVEGAGLPRRPVITAWYALVLTSIVGNFVVPLFFRR